MERARILIVEDMRFIAHFIARNLEKAGYETHTVLRGDEALDAAHAFRPQAVILDLVLPGCSGLEVSRKLRSDPTFEGLAIVIATGHSFDEKSAAEVREAGADAHFTKPVSPSALLATLRRLGVPADASVTTEAPQRAWDAYERALARMLDASGGVADLAAAVETPAGPQWLHGREIRDGVETTLPANGERPAVRLRAPADKAEQLALGRALARAAEPMAVLTRERDGLSAELGVAYESLTTVYEIGCDPSLLADPDRALALILDRVVGMEPGLRALLWVEKDGTLRAVQARGVAVPLPRDLPGTAVERVMQEGAGRVWNDGVKGRFSDPELEDARRVAAAPLLRDEEPVGGLVVWSERPGEFDSRAMGLLTSLLSHAAMILEQDRLKKELVAGERLKHELEVGGRIQRTLLFGRVPPELADLDLGVIAEPCRDVGGDFFEIYAHDEQLFDVLMGDVMGKGLPAALVGAAVKSQFDRHAHTQRASGLATSPLEPREIVAAVHTAVAEQLIELGSFATAVYARFDLRAGTLTYVDCGHTALLHRTTDGAKARAAEFPGRVNLPLGFLAGTRYEQVTVPFDAGDTFLLYTDGVTEAVDADDEMFGEERLHQAFTGSTAGAQEAAEAIRDAVGAFSESGAGDDLTCVVFRAPDVIPESEDAAQVLEVPAVRGYLAEVRDLVARACRRIPGSGFDPATVEMLQVAVVEAASNVIRHAYAPKEAASLRIRAETDADALRFEVSDKGRPFDFGAMTTPEAKRTEGGGFGVMLMSQIMDKIDYSRSESGNRLVLTKHLAKQGEDA